LSISLISITIFLNRFQAAIKKYGVPEEEIFQTPDLFEKRNIQQVVLCLYSLGRITQKHPEFKGPPLGIFVYEFEISVMTIFPWDIRTKNG
jgi:hypothetical protein